MKGQQKAAETEEGTVQIQEGAVATGEDPTSVAIASIQSAATFPDPNIKYVFRTENGGTQGDPSGGRAAGRTDGGHQRHQRLPRRPVHDTGRHPGRLHQRGCGGDGGHGHRDSLHLFPHHGRGRHQHLRRRGDHRHRRRHHAELGGLAGAAHPHGAVLRDDVAPGGAAGRNAEVHRPPRPPLLPEVGGAEGHPGREAPGAAQRSGAPAQGQDQQLDRAALQDHPRLLHGEHQVGAEQRRDPLQSLRLHPGAAAEQPPPLRGAAGPRPAPDGQRGLAAAGGGSEEQEPDPAGAAPPARRGDRHQERQPLTGTAGTGTPRWDSGGGGVGGVGVWEAGGVGERQDGHEGTGVGGRGSHTPTPFLLLPPSLPPSLPAA